ncbi:MAG: glycosyltransferase family 1 protein [Candidatus Daviesbacteria bacterium]|nr:glycosyltransferase family 1 protein [Candidatus Daviesbacteria bacterium]
MKIAIDARMYAESGIGRYIRNLIFNLQGLDTKNQYFILHPKNDIKYQDNFHKITANFKWYGLTEQVKLPGLLKSLKPDLVHFPHFNVPIFYQGKFVVTIHDLIHQHFSMQRSTTRGPLIYKLKQLGYRQVFENALKKSQRILVPSDFVKMQLINNYQINKEKIIVTPEAVDDKLLKIKSANKISFPYIFYVGNAHPHKNIEGLIKAYLKLKKKYKTLKLILTGADHYFWQRIKKEFPDENILYTGYVSDSELVNFYKNAKCFVMPSLEEGFGIPILEAMSLSCPVVSSNAGSLPEVGGDAVIYFNPKDQFDMIQKISQVLDDEHLRQDLIQKGLQRVKAFSWKKLAEQTLEVYHQCV